MPTYETAPGFERQFSKMSKAEKQAFMEDVKLFVAGLRTGNLSPTLRVHRLKGTKDIYSLSWGPGKKGRATFRFQKAVLPEHAHIAWVGVTPDHSLYAG